MVIWMMVNDQAGRRQGRREGERIRQALEQEGHQVRTAFTSSLEEAQRFLEEAAQAQPELLLCCGGDGTLSYAVNTLGRLGVQLRLGYVPLGTTNDFASSLGLPRDPVQAAKQVAAGTPRRLDLGRFQDRDFLYVASFGAFTQSSYKAAGKMKASLGHLAYVLEGMRELPFLKPCTARVETEDASYQGEFLFGAVSNSTSLGGVVKLDPQLVHLDDGLLELTLVPMPKTPLELGQVAGMIGQGKLQGGRVIQRQARWVRITSEEPFPWSLDGEYAPGEPQVEIQALPQALELVG